MTDAPRLRRALEICVLLIVAATALVHPLCLSETALNTLYERITQEGLFRQLLPWVSCGYTPLVLKESVMLTLTSAVLFLYSWIKIRGQWLGLERSAFEGGGWKQWLLKPEFWAFSFLLYGAISVAWSPVFQQSLNTWILMAAGLSVMLVVRSGLFGRSFAIRFMMLCTLCGVVLAVIALLQHLHLLSWLPHPADPRNRMSSLIGHNTGLSSWLMFPLSFSIYFALTNRRLWARIAAMAIAVLFILVIIAAQSRAVWVLGFLICLIVPWRIFRLRRIRIGLTRMLAAIAVVLTIILSLSLSPRTNPLARLPVSLSDRVTGDIFNLDQLRRETRLRIVVVSLAELFPQAPIFGWGLGSFSWVYPKAQGDYLTAHPDNWLGTTTRRTDLAHNDYLQTLIEMGLLGLGLLVAGLYALTREGVRVYRRLSGPYDRAVWWALAVPGTAVLFHALVDFPFHVAPISMVTLVCISLIPCLKTRSESVVTVMPAAPLPNQSPRKATMVALAASIVIFAWLPWGWQALVGRTLISDFYYNYGLSWLKDYRASEGQTDMRRLAMLEKARRSFRESVVANVFNGAAYEGQATACVNRAALVLYEMNKLQVHSDDVESTGIEAMRMAVTRDAQSAIKITNNQLRAGGLRYHYTWYLLGRAWGMLWELEKDTTSPKDSRAYANAVEALRRAVHYNPADATSLRELSDLLSVSQKTAEESRALLSRLFEIDPWSADELLLQPPLQMAAEGEIATARAMLEPIFMKFPDNPRVLLAQAWLAYYEAVWPPPALDKLDREAEYLQWRRNHLEPGWSNIQNLPQNDYFTPQKRQLLMLYMAAAGDIESANKLSKAALDRNMWDAEARAIYYWTQHQLYGGGLKQDESIEYYRTKGLLSLYFMSKRYLGLSLGELAFRKDLTMPEMRRLTAFCEANECWDFLRLILPPIRKTFPGDEALRELADEVEMRAGEAGNG